MAVDSDVVRRAYLKVTGSRGLVGSTLVLYIILKSVLVTLCKYL